MVVAVDGEEPRPKDPKKDANGKAICPCAFGSFHGRHYEDTDAGWELHTKTNPHKNWRQSEFEQSEDEKSRQLVAPAHALPWFQQDRCEHLRHVMETLNLSATLGRSFVKAKVTDADIPMMLFMTEERWIQDFSMQPGQVQIMKEVLRTCCDKGSNAVRNEMETQMNWTSFYNTNFEDQNEYEDIDLFSRDQMQARHMMAPMVETCRDLFLLHNEFAFGSHASLAIRDDHANADNVYLGGDDANAGSGVLGGDDAAEDEEKKKQRAKRLRADRANGRR